MKELIIADPLGFTEQTKTLLYSVGASDLINEFKARNISTNMLHQLTRQDFMQLGATEDHAKILVDRLNISKKKNSDVKTKVLTRIYDNEEILKLGEEHLVVIQEYMTYCRLRLENKSTNSFVVSDKALRASQILCTTADATLKEIKEAKLRLKELEAVIITPEHSLKYSYILYYISIGVAGVAIYKLFTNKF